MYIYILLLMIYNWLARHRLATSLADKIKSNQIEFHGLTTWPTGANEAN